MRTIVIGNTTPNTFMRPFVGTRAQITAANLPNRTLAIVTDEAENSIDLTVVYPVGSIYMNATDDTNPATLFGIGTWSLIDSKFLYGTNSLLSDLGDTGGATTATLTQNNLPTHLHTVTAEGTVASTFTGSSVVSTKQSANPKLVWEGNHSHLENLQSHNSGLGQRLWVQENGFSGEYTGINVNVDSIGSGTVSGRAAITTQDATISIDEFTTGDHTHSVTAEGTVTSTFTGTTVDSSSVGSGTAFSILPTYRKVAIWVRNS